MLEITSIVYITIYSGIELININADAELGFEGLELGKDLCSAMGLLELWACPAFYQ